jgi:hypothetical protein
VGGGATAPDPPAAVPVPQPANVNKPTITNPLTHAPTLFIVLLSSTASDVELLIPSCPFSEFLICRMFRGFCEQQNNIEVCSGIAATKCRRTVGVA